MKRKSCGIIVLLSMFLGAQIGITGDTTEIELGKQHFNDPTFAMSINDKSCNTCHPDGKGIKATANGDYSAMINRCIVGALKGQPLEEDSKKMQAMQTYLQSLAR